MKLHTWIIVVVSCLCALRAPAQTAEEAAAGLAHIHVGPLRVTPTVALTNIGVDTNVFNAADANHPNSDFTATVTPAALAWFHTGRALFTASVKEDVVYYREFASERSVNGFYNIDGSAPLNRFVLKAGAAFLSSRDRPGFEIDARSQHTEGDVHGSLEYRSSGKTTVAATVQQQHVKFDQGAEFMGANLNRELSRTVTSASATIRYRITPVTSLTADVGQQTDRFLYSTGRDSSSTRVAGGVLFGTRLSGSASLGYRTFVPQASDVPQYHGLTAKADVSFATVGATRIGVQVIRDLQYSYDFQQPYYVQTGTTVSFTQGLIGPLNGTGRVGVQQLSYRGRFDTATPLANRTDLVSLVGGSIAYRAGGGATVSFNLDRQQRNSDLAGFGYGGLRFGTSVTYGF